MLRTQPPLKKGFIATSQVRLALARALSDSKPLPALWPISGFSERMLRHIKREELGGLLHYRWASTGRLKSVPVRTREAVRQWGQAAQALDLTRTAELQRVFDALAKRDIAVVTLKGVALAYWLYPSSFARPRCDCDLLVKASQLAACEALLYGLGYRRIVALPGQHVLRQRLWQYQHLGVTHQIDLHHRLSNRHMFDDVLDEQRYFNNAQPLARLHPFARRPDLVDATIHAIVHRVAHHHSDQRLVWLYDIHLLLSHATEEQRLALSNRLETHRLVAVATECIRQCEHLFATKPLTLKRQLGVREPSAQLLNQPGTWRLLWLDLICARNWRTRVSYLQEMLWPDHLYLRSRFPDASSHSRIALNLRRWLNTRHSR